MPFFLGVICHGWHESAAVLVRDGHVLAAAEEERFSRRKFDNAFPEKAAAFCLKQAGIRSRDLSAAGYAFDPRRKLFLKGLHILKHLPRSVNLLTSRGDMLQRMNRIGRQFREVLDFDGPVLRFNHHLCHAASSFTVSPFQEAAILAMDGCGDWEATWWGVGRGTHIAELGRLHWPLSLGHVYAAFTEYLGFKAFSDEYRVMGLAPYGKPVFLREMEAIFRPSGKGYAIDFGYFNFPTGHFPRYGAKIVETFGPALRDSGDEIPEHYRNVGASLQAQVEKIILHLAALAVRQSGVKRLCLAGGVAMNCVANGRIVSEGIAEDLYVPPCASDAGAALGAALLAESHITGRTERRALDTALLGPEYDDGRIEAAFREKNIPVQKTDQPAGTAARLLAEGKVIGWFQGRMEFGQRALGGRSILADPRKAEMKDIINAKVKFREFFRPFAPSVLEERAADFFACPKAVPFMTEVYPVRPEKKAVIPAVTHVDGTARVQTVSRRSSPLYYEVIRRFGELTGVPVLLNTSFNVKGQPIVNTPEEAVETYLKTDIDALVCGRFLASKNGI